VRLRAQHAGPRRRRRARQLWEVARLAATVGPEELDLLLLLLRRVQSGQATYGRLRVEDDRRAFVGEALEEIVDGLFYLGAALLRRRHRSPATRGRFRNVER
jgi:hypothetical protein